MVLVVWLWPSAPVEAPRQPTADAQPLTGVQAGPTRGANARVKPQADAGAPGLTAAEPGVLANFGWGSGAGNLGRSRPEEANPEAPMSLAVDSKGTTWILDQVNQRIVRVDKQGQPAGEVPLTLQAAQDIAIADDGTAVVIDRLVDKSIALMSPDGTLKGELPLEGKGLEEGGAATGIFTDGDDVYVEREHSDLVRVGNTSGTADGERPEVPGRPSRDGKAWLSANIVDGPAGQVLVTAIEREGQQHRFTRQYTLGAPVMMLNLLDSDASGIIYLGSVVEVAGSSPDAPRFGIQLMCLDPLDGRPLGRVMLPTGEGPDETVRELVVRDEGGVLYLQRTEAGAQVRVVNCP